MTAGVIFLLGLIAIWIGVTGRGKTMWLSITGGSADTNPPQQTQPGQPF